MFFILRCILAATLVVVPLLSPAVLVVREDKDGFFDLLLSVPGTPPLDISVMHQILVRELLPEAVFAHTQTVSVC